MLQLADYKTISAFIGQNFGNKNVDKIDPYRTSVKLVTIFGLFVTVGLYSSHDPCLNVY